MITLAIILAVLVLIALIPVGVQVCYDQRGLLLRVMAGAVGLQLYPKKEKALNARRLARKQKRAARRRLREAARQEARQQKPKKQGKPSKPQAPKKKLDLADIWQLLEVGKALLGDMRRKLRVRTLWLRVRFGGEDAARSAMLYGRAWALIGAVMPTLETLFHIDDRDVAAEYDPTKSQMELTARLDLRVRIGSMVALGAKAAFRFLKIFIKQKKGGAET